MRISYGLLLLMLLALDSLAQNNRIDMMRPDAPQLALFGPHPVGVTTLRASDMNRVDVLSTAVGGEPARYDRTLTLEVWYPASPEPGTQPGELYQTQTRNPAIEATLIGRAMRDVAPLISLQPYPLVILSHGYPGNRFLMSHLGENLASKGYVVASIDHLESTYDDQADFASTLFHRTLDQRFVIQHLATTSASSDNFLFGVVDTQTVGMVGYSMGGFGLMNNLGAGYNPALINSPSAPPNGLLAEHTELNTGFRAGLDTRIKAGVAIAPWGMNHAMWRAEDVQKIKTPTLYVSGSLDITSGYDNGTRLLFDLARNSDRYLLTFDNASHSAGAPIPVPIELLNSADGVGVDHYTDPVWDTLRMNNIMDHFVTAFFDYRLKGMQARLSYLQLPPNSAQGWLGFENGPAHGLRLEHHGLGEPLAPDVDQ